jgi:hypothetical protein
MLISYGPVRNRVGIAWLFFITTTPQPGDGKSLEKAICGHVRTGRGLVDPQAASRAVLPGARADRPRDAGVGVNPSSVHLVIAVVLTYLLGFERDLRGAPTGDRVFARAILINRLPMLMVDSLPIACLIAQERQHRKAYVRNSTPI